MLQAGIFAFGRQLVDRLGQDLAEAGQKVSRLRPVCFTRPSMRSGPGRASIWASVIGALGPVPTQDSAFRPGRWS